MTIAVERRQHRRSVVKGSLRFQSSEYSQTARIANLSAGGAFVLTGVTAPERLLRRVVDVSFRLDTGDAEWIATKGEIVRVRPDSVAIAFVEAPPMLVHMLDEVASASRAHSRVIAVILLDENAERRTALATGFASAGCSVIAAASPLEAIVRL